MKRGLRLFVSSRGSRRRIHISRFDSSPDLVNAQTATLVQSLNGRICPVFVDFTPWSGFRRRRRDRQKEKVTWRSGLRWEKSHARASLDASADESFVCAIRRSRKGTGLTPSPGRSSQPLIWNRETVRQECRPSVPFLTNGRSCLLIRVKERDARVLVARRTPLTGNQPVIG